MDPFTLGVGIVGLGLQLFGGSKASEDAQKAAQINSGIAADEGQINEQKRTQMEMTSRRQQLETMRNAQRARAQATAAAVNQGANQGSGIQGGLGQITSQESFNSIGISNNLAIGENIFDINKDISGKKQQLSQVQGQQASDTALMSLGGAMVGSAKTIGSIGQFGFGSVQNMNLGQGLFGGNSPTGYGR